MRIRVLVAVLGTTAAAATSATPAMAAPMAGAWTGKATSMDGKVKYGDVSFKVKGSTIRNLKIGFVPTSGCGTTTLVIPKATIKGSRFTGAVQPVDGTDQIVSVNGTISARKAKATFSAGPLCEGAGRFTATAG